MGNDEFIKSVESSIKQLTTKTVKDTFFNNWFKGKIYSFIFKENYGVTNIQYRELLSLIRSNCSISKNLIFMTSEDFRNKINNIIMSEWKEAHIMGVSDDENMISNFAQDIADKYSESFERIIVIDSYYQSCLVFLPPRIEIDLESICFLSGYIHSCGENIYFRNIDKATSNEFIINLGEHGVNSISKNQNVEGVIVPLTHDKNLKANQVFRLKNIDNLTSTLDTMKLYLGKAHLDDKLLSEFLDDINNSYIIQITSNPDFSNVDDMLKKKEMCSLTDVPFTRENVEFVFVSGDRIDDFTKEEKEKLTAILKSKMIYKYHIDLDGFKNEFYDGKLWNGQDCDGKYCDGELCYGKLPGEKPCNGRNCNRKLPDKNGGAYNIPCDGSSCKRRDIFWLLIDHNISHKASSPGEESYYGCVKIDYINNSPFAIFDEDKPGWVDQVTLPHSLTAAMINIAMENVNFYNGFTERRTICDPFVGTGTTYLEALKYFEHTSFIGGDCDASSLKAFSDNLVTSLNCSSEICAKSIYEFLKSDDFFRTIVISKGGDDSFNKHLDACWDYLGASIHNTGIEESKLKLYEDSKEIHDILSNIPGDTKTLDTIIQILKPILPPSKTTDDKNLCELAKRHYGYCVIKAYKRNRNVALNPKSKFEAVQVEFKNLKSHLDTLANQYDKATRQASTSSSSGRFSSKIMYLDYNYKFCTLNQNLKLKYSFSDEFKLGQEIIKSDDENMIIYLNLADALLKKTNGDGVDIIITDPPYGFNTGTSNEEKEALRTLYSTIFEEMVSSIKDNGCIILCLPSKSHSGKHLHYYSLRDSVIPKLYDAVSNLTGVSIQQDFTPCILPSDLYKAPFYWNSKKALKRDILFFRFNRRKATNGDKGQ